ncbi:MAG: hypothetical protein L0Z49_11195 [Actinobacteria bacterium]|nr:hypothetical protein [Actinomycetota bacterium]
MPNPTPGSVHVNGLLTDISVAFIQSSTKFVAPKVFPMVGVQKQSDVYATYSRADFFRDEVERRAAGSAYRRLGYRTDNTANYRCEEFGAEHPIDDQLRANADAPYNPERDAVQFLTQKMLIRMERDWTAKFFSTGNIWTGSSDGADKVGGTDFTRFSNAASSPIEVVQTDMREVEEKTGFLPNKLVIGRQVWYDLRNHPDVVDRYKHTSADSITTAMVARLFELDEILVSGAVHNTAAEGVAHVGAHIASDNMLLVYSAPSPSLMLPSGGYTFMWNGLVRGANNGVAIETYREDQVSSDIIRVKGAWDHKVVTADIGIFYTDASTNA